MKILLDECLPARLKALIVGHDVTTTREMGWAGKKNGELLSLAAKEFDIFLTSDRNLSFQQNPKKYSVTIVILHGKSNAYDDLGPLMAKFLSAIQTPQPGNILHVR